MADDRKQYRARNTVNPVARLEMIREAQEEQDAKWGKEKKSKGKGKGSIVDFDDL